MKTVKTSTRRLRGLLVALGVSAVAAAALPGLAQGRGGDKHVVLISLDGFAADYLNDARLPMPNIRGLAAEGAHAERMQVSTPSVTWPNHTTLVTGVPPAKHGVLANGVIERTNNTGPYGINPRKSRYELCRVPTVYDAAKQAGQTTAEINWPVTRGATTLDILFPDHPEAISHTTPSLVKDLVDMKLLAAPNDAAFNLGAVGRDQVWVRAATHVIRTRKPNLTLIHLLNTDGQQHAHGPQSTEAYTALSLADRYVGDIVKSLDDAGIRKRSTVMVTADHGFVKVTKQIAVNARLASRGLILRREGGGTDYQVQSISEGGLALVYFPNKPATRDLTAATKAALQGMEGIERIFDPSQYGEIGVPKSGDYAQGPDLVLAAKDGYAFSNALSGDEIVTQERTTGSHGYVQTNPRVDALFVMQGRGVKRGASEKFISNLSVAPTIAKLLGVELANVDGTPLNSLLEGGR